MIKKFEANKARLRRHQRIRRHIEGTSSRPRLNVFRSGQHIYAQVIDDSTGRTLVAASSLDESLRKFEAPVAEQTTSKVAEEPASAPVVEAEEHMVTERSQRPARRAADVAARRSA